MEKCVCYDGNFNSCPYLDAVNIIEIKGFKGEKSTHERRCDYQMYIGPSIVVSNFTREEFNQLIKESTLCTY